jgi:predicted DsbA family dithiol-disulfide isomerase
LAAIYFQAVVHQDPDKALLFKNMVFAQQEELKKGEPFLQEIAAAVGVDREKLAEDVQSPLTRATIEADITEAGNFQFIGVPVFLVNGSPVYGVPVREELYRLIEAKLAQAKE